MIKKSLLLFSLLWGLCISTYTQNECDIVYLSNGGTITGKVIERNRTAVNIQTPDGKIYTYRAEDVEKVIKGDCDAPAPQRWVRKSAKGYRGFLELGGGLEIGKIEGRFMFSAQTSHGYQFNPYFYLGAGVALNWFNLVNSVHYSGPQRYGPQYVARTFIPVFGNFKVNFTKKPVSPFFDFKMGGSVSKSKGLYMNPTIGISVGRNTTVAANIGIGYCMQKDNEYSYTYYLNYVNHYDSVTTPKTWHGIRLSVGIEF